MLAFGTAVALPVWLAPVVVALTAFGAAANALGSIVSGYVSVRRLELMDKQRTEREQAQHTEVLDAINAKQR